MRSTMRTRMERTWLKAYPPGVPTDIDPARYRSLPDLLDESFEAFASRQAFACMGRTLTYAELDVQSRNLGAWLQSKGLARGARVAIMMPNVLQYPVAMAAILRAGYVIVNVNPLYTPRELEHQLADSGAEAIVLLEPFDAVLRAVQRNTRVLHVVVTSIGEMMGVSMAASDSLTSDGQAPTPAPVSGTRWRKAPAARLRVPISSPMTWLCCNTPAARRAFPKGRCCCIGT